MFQEPAFGFSRTGKQFNELTENQWLTIADIVAVGFDCVATINDRDSNLSENFKKIYAQKWIIQRLGYQTPSQAGRNTCNNPKEVA